MKARFKLIPKVNTYIQLALISGCFSITLSRPRISDCKCLLLMAIFSEIHRVRTWNQAVSSQKMPLISRPATRSGIRGLVFGGKQLEFMFCLGSQKDMPLTSLYYTWVICHLVLLKSLLDIYFFSLGGARTILCLFISYFPHFLLGFLKWDFPVLKSFPETRRWERQNQSLILS